MHPDDEHLLVIGTVEDSEPPPLGQTFGVAPQKIVADVFGRRFFERKYLTALRIDARHDVLDCAVLTGCIHRLKNEQKRPAALGVENLLRLREIGDASREEQGRIALVELQFTSGARIEIL